MTKYSSQCDKSLKVFIVVSFILTCTIGVLMHFAYEFSGKSTWVSLIAPINESTWEHLKLQFFPLVIVSIPAYLILSSKKRGEHFTAQFFTGSLLGFLCGIIFTVTAFYTINGILGRDYTAIDIAIFFVAVLIEHMVFYSWICPRRHNPVHPLRLWVSVVLFLTIAALFFLFTFVKPPIGLFADPLDF